MLTVKYNNSPNICTSIRFDIIKLNNKRHIVRVPNNAANFSLVDK